MGGTGLQGRKCIESCKFLALKRNLDVTSKKPRPLTIQDENGRTLETEHQIAGAFARKLEKQFQISEGKDVDFDLEFAFRINAEWQNRKPSPIEETTPEEMGEEGTIEESFTLEDVNTALESFAEKALGASEISKMYLTVIG